MREEDTQPGSVEVGGEEVSVVTAGTAGDTLHLALHLSLNITY